MKALIVVLTIILGLGLGLSACKHVTPPPASTDKPDSNDNTE